LLSISGCSFFPPALYLCSSSIQLASWIFLSCSLSLVRFFSIAYSSSLNLTPDPLLALCAGLLRHKKGRGRSHLYSVCRTP
jgi:hypothetical protein